MNGKKEIILEIINNMEQWELPNNTIVKLPDGKLATFLKMDGMYAR
jgi:predicted DNA-binding protein